MVVIYVLKDPRDGAVRYVGQTIRPETRTKEHKSIFFSAALQRGVEELETLGLEPAFQVVRDVSPNEDAKRAEERDIQRQLLRGASLLNKNLMPAWATWHDVEERRGAALASQAVTVARLERELADARAWQAEIEQLFKAP